MAVKARLFWYQFRQNNSGGSFDTDQKKGIGMYVFIQAPDTNLAIKKAYSIGIYFDGCKKGLDCDCCGDRWSRPDKMIDSPLDQFLDPNSYVSPFIDSGVYAHRYDSDVVMELIPVQKN